MSVLGVGVDLVENARIQHSLDRFGERFLHRIFTAGEIEYCQSMKFPARHFAARFAAKEAVAKTFGTGIGASVGWLDIEVAHQPSGAPYVILHGAGAELVQDLGIHEVLLSLSHSEHYAVANAVAIAADAQSSSSVPLESGY